MKSKLFEVTSNKIIVAFCIILSGCSDVTVRDGNQTYQTSPGNLAEGLATNYVGAALVVGGALFDLATLPVRVIASGGVDNVEAGPGSGSVGARIAARGVDIHGRSIRLLTSQELEQLAQLPEYKRVRVDPPAGRPQEYFSDRCVLNSRTGDLACEKTIV